MAHNKSFSFGVKQELAKITENRHCRIAELSAIINSCSTTNLEYNNGLLKILKSDNVLLRERFFALASMDFDIQIANIENTKNSELLIKGNGIKSMLLCLNKYNPSLSGFIYHTPTIDSLIIKSECCKKAYIRGSFLAAGYILNPKGDYHMEFFYPNDTFCKEFMELFRFFGLSPKFLTRRGMSYIYFKEAEQISTLLNIMKAHVALMEFENLRIEKEVKASINRLSNGAAANEYKIIDASASQVKDILTIKQNMGLNKLNKNLLEVALLRLENPLASLSEIAKMTSPPITKSGTNHRLKKISQIAKDINNK